MEEFGHTMMSCGHGFQLVFGVVHACLDRVRVQICVDDPNH